MAIPAYCWLVDSNNIPIHGDVSVAGREGCVEILALSHEVCIPTDRDTGAVTATRKHGAVCLQKSVDKSSPYLYKACCSGQSLKKVVIRWYRIIDDGLEKPYFEHTLLNVKVMSVKHLMLDVKRQEYDQQPHLERVELRYSTIIWNYLEGNISHMDDWAQR